jgi:tRNA pseudouridine13 synthase
MEKVLAEEGVQPEQFRLKGFRKMFFSRGERPALCLPENLSHEVGTDELKARKKKITLTFDLQPGSYATLIVKRGFKE